MNLNVYAYIKQIRNNVSDLYGKQKKYNHSLINYLAENMEKLKKKNHITSFNGYTFAIHKERKQFNFCYYYYVELQPTVNNIKCDARVYTKHVIAWHFWTIIYTAAGRVMIIIHDDCFNARFLEKYEYF